MRVTTEVLSSLKPPHPSGLRPATFPPCGGTALVRSNRAEFAPLWDVCVHFLEIKAAVRASDKTGRSRRAAGPHRERRLGKRRRRSRTARPEIFRQPRAQWPGGDLDQSLRFCAPEIKRSRSGAAPVNGVQGGANMDTKCPSERTPGGFSCLLAAQKALAPQGETPFQKRNLPQNPLNKQQKAPASRRGLLLVCVVKEREKWEIVSSLGTLLS